MAWKPFSNFGLKVAALALGTLLWFTVTQHPWFTVAGHEIERRVPVRLSYKGVPAGLELTGNEFEDVEVHVRGGEEDVNNLTSNRISILVDLSDAHPGTNLVPLRTDEVAVPMGIEVLEVAPGSLPLTLEKSGQTTVAIHPTVEGIPAPGYRVAAITVDPATAVVEGPESRIQRPFTVVTDRIGIDGRTTTVAADVNIGVTDAELRLRGPRAVHVTVRVEKASLPERTH